MEYPQNELLSVSISPVGHEHLKTLKSSTRLCYIISIVVSVLFFLMTAGRLADAYREKISDNLALYIEMRYATWLYLLMTVLTPIEFYLYYRFVKRAKKAVDHSDAEQFNQSFRYMIRGNYLALFMMASNVLIAALQIWVGMRN